MTRGSKWRLSNYVALTECFCAIGEQQAECSESHQRYVVLEFPQHIWDTVISRASA
jgi:hypothetical protein